MIRGFSVVASLGHRYWWVSCEICGVQLGQARSEDRAIAMGFAHLDDRHPEVDPEEVEAAVPATIVYDREQGTTVCLACRVVLYGLDALDAHLDREHPWQQRAIVSPRDRVFMRPTPRPPERPHEPPVPDRGRPEKPGKP